jgi:ribose/xylose/arabinose/galactoside ABC-type transport system permease subunit
MTLLSPSADAGTPAEPSPVANVHERSMATRVLTSRFGPYVGLGSVLAVLVVYMWATNPIFASWANVTNVMRGSSVIIILSIGMTFVLLTAGVDLSIGAMLGLCSLLYAQFIEWHLNGFLALVLTLLCGALLGYVGNGILIGRAQISFFVITLGTMSIYRGVALLWNDKSVDMYGDRVSTALGNDTVLDGRVPIGFIVAMAAVVLTALVLRRTTFGRSVYAVGGNREAAELSGIKAGRAVAWVYGISGICAGLAAVMTIGRTTIAQATAGTNVELRVVAVVLLGGVALSGGIGSIWGTLLGVAFLQILGNALDLSGVSSYWQMIMTGAILIVAISLDRVRTRRNGA